MNLDGGVAESQRKKTGKDRNRKAGLSRNEAGAGVDLRPGESTKELLCREYTLRQPAQTPESTPRWPHVLAAETQEGSS